MNDFFLRNNKRIFTEKEEKQSNLNDYSMNNQTFNNLSMLNQESVSLNNSNPKNLSTSSNLHQHPNHNPNDLIPQDGSLTLQFKKYSGGDAVHTVMRNALNNELQRRLERKARENQFSYKENIRVDFDQSTKHEKFIKLMQSQLAGGSFGFEELKLLTAGLKGLDHRHSVQIAGLDEEQFRSRNYKLDENLVDEFVITVQKI